MKSIVLAFAMFSRIPMPNTHLEERSMRYLLPAFPLVGVAVGAIAIAWGWLCGFLELGAFPQGAGLALVPLIVSGGIHMDGFCDTVDALASNGDIEKKQRILRDPHIGSFGAVSACAYLIAFSALASVRMFSVRELLCFALSLAQSRAVAALALLVIPGSGYGSLGKMFTAAAGKRTSLVLLGLEMVVLGAAVTHLCGVAGLIAFAASFALLALCRLMAVRQFGGMSGDVSGWLLQLCELASVAALTIVPKVVEKI